jgi:hypothetical protein
VATREIILFNGMVAVVDEEDYPEVSKHRWYFCKTKKGCDKGYPQTYFRLEGKPVVIRLHRFVTKAVHGQRVDHIDRNPLNNSKANLRFSTPSQNQCNIGLRNEEKTSRFKGVYWSPSANGWYSQIAVNRSRISLGKFPTEDEAAQEHDRAAMSLHGEFAWLNFPHLTEKYRANPWTPKARSWKKVQKKSRYVGVCPGNGAWVASFSSHRLGTYQREIEAATAYDLVVTWKRREYGRINFPQRRAAYLEAVKDVDFSTIGVAGIATLHELVKAELQRQPPEE